MTLSREMFGPDVAASVTTSELALLGRRLRRALCPDEPLRDGDLD